VGSAENEAGGVDSETLFRRHAAFVASFLHRQGARAADLDDLVQEVFMMAHRKGGYRPGPASPTTFLARLALEAHLTHRRRSVRFREAQHEDVGRHGSAPPPRAPDCSVALHEAAHQLEQVLERMEPAARAVFVLFELEGQACEAIAAGLGIPLGTVYSRLHAARKTFAAKLARIESTTKAPLSAVRRPA
jgi:RNA polymerase sigma-70 factor (ECF subfamily)